MNKPEDRNPPEKDDVFAEIAAGARPVELAAGTRDALRQRVLELARDTAPEGTRTVRAEEGAWRAIDSHIRLRVLERNVAARTQTVLLRVAPGGRYPGHRHTQEEEFIVLEGECHIGAHRLGTGDVHIAAPGSWHDDITTTTGVLVLVRGEIWSG